MGEQTVKCENPACGKETPQTRRKKRFCSDTCRFAFWKLALEQARRAATKTGPESRAT